MIPIIFGSLDCQLGNPNRWKIFRGQKYAYIYRFNTKIQSTMLCLSGFELYSRWVPLCRACFIWRYFYCASLGSSLGMDSNVQCHCHCSSFFSEEKMVSFFSSENKNLFKNFNNVNLCWLPFMEEPVQSNLEKYRWLSLHCNVMLVCRCIA